MDPYGAKLHWLVGESMVINDVRIDHNGVEKALVMSTTSLPAFDIKVKPDTGDR